MPNDNVIGLPNTNTEIVATARDLLERCERGEIRAFVCVAMTNEDPDNREWIRHWKTADGTVKRMEMLGLAAHLLRETAL